MDQGILSVLSEPVPDHPDTVRVVLEGSIDPKTNNKFRDDMKALLDKGTKQFLIDCAKLTYVNSSGLAYMLNVAGGVKPKGGIVVLAALDPKILVIFKMMGILHLFEFQPSYAEALKELDQKVARQLADVGPALQLGDEPPKPAAPATPAPRVVTPRPAPPTVTPRPAPPAATPRPMPALTPRPAPPTATPRPAVATVTPRPIAPPTTPRPGPGPRPESTRRLRFPEPPPRPYRHPVVRWLRMLFGLDSLDS
jgi:anti-anti-sigma factor